MKTEYQFRTNISRQEYLKYYSGVASCIQVISEEGVKLRFPASAMKPWVTHQGISGRFMIKFDADHKLVELVKLD